MHGPFEFVIPAKAGIQTLQPVHPVIPAFAGMTVVVVRSGPSSPKTQSVMYYGYKYNKICHTCSKYAKGLDVRAEARSFVVLLPP